MKFRLSTYISQRTSFNTEVDSIEEAAEIVSKDLRGGFEGPADEKGAFITYPASAITKIVIEVLE